jgi:tetratricopeptide (TPR) repeat protein
MTRSDVTLALAEQRAREARQRGLREGNAGRPAAGARHLRAGLRQLGWTRDGQQLAAEHRRLAARMLMTLAGWECEIGHVEEGLRLLAEAGALSTPQERGLYLLQLGLIRMLTGRESEARGHLDEAIAVLQSQPAEHENLATALLDRSFAHLHLGQVRQARADLVWCRQVSGDNGHDVIGAKALHNLGYCDLLAGDIPAALRAFTAAGAAYRDSAPGFLLVLATDKATALLAAGLASDAAGELDTAMAASRQQRLYLNLAEAQLTRAHAALASGDAGGARRWASAAEHQFRQHGNDAWACLAELTRLQARSGSAAGQARLAARALLLTGRLRDRGLINDANLAELLAARALITAGRHGQARQLIAARRGRGRAEPLTVSLLRQLARAELAELEAEPGRALAQLRTGLAMVQARRGRLGSLDLQTGAAALGTDLAAAGLRIAVSRRSAPLVFAWLERSRAQAFRVRPVLPPANPQVASILAELRQIGYLIRDAELNGVRDPAAIARRTELQREIREHDWQAGGLGEPAALARLGEVSIALEQGGLTLVSFLAIAGALLAVVVRRGSACLVTLGDAKAAAEAARRLAADLDTLAGRRLPARLETVIRESARHQADVLTAQVIAPLRAWISDDSLVIVPAGPLAGLPWAALPGLRGRPLTVCPSASSWLAADRHGRAAGRWPAVPPILVAGPDLDHAAWEIAQVANLYPGCRSLDGEKATVRETLAALDGAPLAHLAAHGHHDHENVLFSRLDLADGPLMAYDIQQVPVAPRHVVLSACDVGRTVLRPGEEVLGFTAALLYMGTATIISSVTRIADADAVGMMTTYHRLLAGGADPAGALAEAALAVPFSPFVCFGSGSAMPR